MDLDDFRSILDTAGVDVWTFIDTAILVASLDYGQELKNRRDNIVERLYATSMVTKCRNCDFGGRGGGENRVNGNEIRENMIDEDEKEQENERDKPVNVDDEEEEDFDPFASLFDDEQTKILEIKDQLEDPDLSEESLVEMLQNLADMDITFKALQETDIGRHVNKVRKHPSNNVRRLSKQLVRKWKETVDEWVKLNQPGDLQQSTLLDGDSPDQKVSQNGHLQQVPDFGYSPNPHYGSSSSDKNNYEPERKPRPAPPPPRKEMNSPAKPFRPSPAPQRTQKEREPRERKDGDFDLETATKRLQQNYRQAENAKKQRTIQVMDIHDIPKPKKGGFFPKKAGGGGGGSSHGRHW